MFKRRDYKMFGVHVTEAEFAAIAAAAAAAGKKPSAWVRDTAITAAGMVSEHRAMPSDHLTRHMTERKP